jgi:hypothetical protein
MTGTLEPEEGKGDHLSQADLLAVTLAVEGGRFLARFIRVLFLTLFWMARSAREGLREPP